MKLIVIACGGAIGALARYGISRWAYIAIGTGFPWGTLVANLLGCALIGFLGSYVQHHLMPESVRHFVMIGFLGALTTFSTFALEAILLFRSDAVVYGLIYVLVSNLGGLLLAALCFWLGLVLIN